MKTSLNSILLAILLFLVVNNIVQTEQCWTILTTRNNMGSKILFRPVFNNIVAGWAFFAV
jgi:hypothetical protein